MYTSYRMVLDTDSRSMPERALFTDREREILSGEADDVTDNYRYKVESVARQRIRRLSADVDALESNQEELLEQLREVVCSDE